MVILGLSKANIERLQEGKPIFFEGSEVGLPGQAFAITFGETEQVILSELEAMLRHEVH
jgi:hypothetical protein